MTAERPIVPAAWLLAWLALLALTALVYLPALPGPLLLDDSGVIAPLLGARDGGHAWVSFLFSDSGPLGRPLAMASFIGNAALHGADLRAWKATNLALHLLNGALLGALVVLLGRATGATPRAARGLALASAALWLCHPLHVSTVMYLVQRMTQLATLFGLLALLLHAHGRLLGADTARGRVAILLAWCVCAPLAALGKEIGLLTPFYLAALELTVFAATPRPRWLRALLLAATLAPLALAALWLALRWQRMIVLPYTLREFGLLERLLTEARVLVDYLQWTLAPRRAALGFYHDDIAIARWPPTWSTLAALALHLVLVGGAWLARRRAPLVAFGVLLFYLGHALESSFFPLELAFEHRNYLPAAGVVIALAAAAARWLGAWRGPALCAVLALAFLAVTAGLTPLWGNEGALYASFLRAHPDSPRARASAVEWLLGQRQYEAAAQLLGDAGDVTAGLHRLRLACLRDGHADAAAAGALATAARAPRPDDMTVEILLWLVDQAPARCGLDDGLLVATLDALRDRPLSTTSRLRFYIAGARLRQARGEWAEALAALATAARIAPRDPYPRYFAAEVALDAGDGAAARRWLDEANALAAQQHEDFSQMAAGLERALGAP